MKSFSTLNDAWIDICSGNGIDPKDPEYEDVRIAFWLGCLSAFTLLFDEPDPSIVTKIDDEIREFFESRRARVSTGPSGFPAEVTQ